MDVREPVAVTVADPVSDLLPVVDGVAVLEGVSVVAAVCDEDPVTVSVIVCVYVLD